MHLNGFTTETKLPLNHAVPAGVVCTSLSFVTNISL